MNSSKLEIPSQSPCPCKGGQSCIVDRRLLNDIVYEDVVFIQHKLRVRKNCLQPYTKSQEKILKKYTNIYDNLINLKD